jgi:uncharacterized lipoprotein YddW (UPF0748 family)
MTASHDFPALMRFRHLALLLPCWLALSPLAGAQTNEFRAYWVDAFGAGIKTASQVTTLVSDLRAGNFNAVVVQVRKRGDAYYTPNTAYPDHEPRAADIATSFDPLADLLAKAHDTSGGKARIEVHTWLVTYPIWNSTTAPANAQHPFNRHPEWLNRTDAGTTYSDGNYYFDPGHPGVQRHTYNTAMDVLTRYDVDGINFDYIRYMGRQWGYNTNSVTRFNTRFGRTGAPAQTDAAWLQFRRDQVTGLLRKVWLNARAIKPNVKISADTITWAPGPTSVANWLSSSAAYTSVLQDWRGWMEEGILDLNLPMAYFDQGGNYTRDWTNWNNFAKDHQYQRHVAIGPGAYLNWASNSIAQLRVARTASPAGNSARGVCAYSYRVPFKGAFTNISRATFHAVLVTNGPSVLDPVGPGVFNQPATIPTMPWKTTPTAGHLMGYLFGGATNNPLDGALVTLTGPANRVQTNDGTGFYGFVDLPPGTYTISASMPGVGTATAAVSISQGVVAVRDLILTTEPPNDGVPPVISGLTVTEVGPYSATLVWATDEPASSVVELGVASLAQALTNAARVSQHSVRLSGLAASTPWQFRVRCADLHGNAAQSAVGGFTTAPAAPVADVIVDDSAALTVGSWTTSSASPGYWGSGYRYASAGTGTKYVEFRPDLPHNGSYNVFAWYVASFPGGNRTTNAQHVIAHAEGTATVGVNQQANGSQWFPLGVFPFAAGNSGAVRVTDIMPETTKLAMADGIRWQFIPPLPVAPVLTLQPGDTEVFTGQSVTFSAEAVGTLPMAYQWRFNGSAIPGATNLTLVLPNPQPADAGQYAVHVTNPGGWATSASALLVVNLPEPGAFSAVQMQPDGQVRLRLTGSPGATYHIETSTNLVQWQPLATLELPGGVAEILDSAAVTNRLRFYRSRP